MNVVGFRLRSLTGSRNNAQLHQQGEHIGQAVFTDDLAIFQLVDVHSCHTDTLACGGNSHEGVSMWPVMV